MSERFLAYRKHIADVLQLVLFKCEPSIDESAFENEENAVRILTDSARKLWSTLEEDSARCCGFDAFSAWSDHEHHRSCIVNLSVVLTKLQRIAQPGRSTWDILRQDLKIIALKDREYGGSWKKRGGVGAFMMLARKWDRIENFSDRGLMTLENMRQDIRRESIIDDVVDLRCYLVLVESELRV